MPFLFLLSTDVEDVQGQSLDSIRIRSTGEGTMLHSACLELPALSPSSLQREDCILVASKVTEEHFVFELQYVDTAGEGIVHNDLKPENLLCMQARLGRSSSWRGVLFNGAVDVCFALEPFVKSRLFALLYGIFVTKGWGWFILAERDHLSGSSLNFSGSTPRILTKSLG